MNTRATSRLDLPHDRDCPAVCGDPDQCRCDTEPVVRDRPATPAEMRRMHALFRKAGYTDRAERLAATAYVIRRTVTSANTLTERETRAVCAWLDQQIESAEQ